MKDVHVVGQRKGIWVAPEADHAIYRSYGPRMRQSLFAFGPKGMTSEPVFMRNREQTTGMIHPDSVHYAMGGNVYY